MDAMSSDSALLPFSQHPGAKRKTSVEHKVLGSRSETRGGLGKRGGKVSGCTETELPSSREQFPVKPERTT